MTGEYIEKRNGGYCVAGTRISLDSVVYAFDRGESPETILENFPLLTLGQIYGAIAFYLHHRNEVRKYLEDQRRLWEAVPLQQENPELWSRLERAREALRKSGS